MRIRSCAISDVGRKRQKNEDSYLLNDTLNLYIVADGMGGHAGGEYASRIAITTIENRFRGAGESLSNAETLVADAIREASAKIMQKAEEDRALKGMGTTVVCLHIDGKKAILGHVGDSRAYLFRDGALDQITEDHSLVNEQVKNGLITAEEARTHQFKNIITRSVGVTTEVEPDIFSRKLKEGDLYLICSDGLSNLVEAHEMEKELKEKDKLMAAKNLVDLANKRGGDDNITLVAVHVYEL